MENLVSLQNQSWLNSYLYWVLLFLLPIIYYYRTITKKFNFWREKGVDGPPSIPLVGNMFHPLKPTPKLHLENCQKYGSCFGAYQGQTPVLVISDPVVIKRILVQDFHMFRNRMKTPVRHKVMSQNLVNARGEKWKRIRSILTPMFTSSKLKKMDSLMEQCINSMIGSMEKMADEKKDILVHKTMGNYTMDVIAKCAFATETNAHNDEANSFVKYAKKFLAFDPIRVVVFIVIPGILQRLITRFKIPYLYNNSIDFFMNISFGLIRNRRNNSEKHKFNDMLQLMIEAEHQSEFNHEDQSSLHHVNHGTEEAVTEQNLLKQIIGSKHLTTEEIAAQAIVFFLAGYETTASTLTYCLYELAQNPEIQERLYEELKESSDDFQKPFNYTSVMQLTYLDAVISETLRKWPPAYILSRETDEEYYIPEFNLKLHKNCPIMIPIFAIHRNEKFYKNPEKFDPERFMPENRDSLIPYTYLPFGGGPRNCIGMRFALSEAKLGLAKIVEKFVLKKSPKTSDNLKIKNSLFLMKTEPVYVGLQRRPSKN